MPDQAPKTTDSFAATEGAQIFYLSLVSWIFLGALRFRGRLDDLGVLIGAVLSVGIAWGITRLVRGGSAIFADKFVGGVLQGAGNIKRQHEFSRQETMIARGQFDDAAESFRLHLMEFPDDIPARYRLATLHLRERNDPAAAESELSKIRQRPHDRSMAMLLANHFVDLYRATGQKGKLMAELTKMMKDWPGTPMAQGAAKLLEETRRDRGGS
ncbi:MAG TPA: tetratricopeptide repeat protein [Gemmatimonadales bacterium]|nr:tetratricopeptide repeat protein [Gemmatimonadales bacterium]